MLHFTNIRLIDPEAGTDDEGSLTVDGGQIVALNGEVPKGARVIDGAGRCLAPGIVDWGVKIGEPGERHRESFRSAGLAAAAGGVTTIVARPDTLPAIDTPETLEFVTRRAAAASPVRIRHMAALTKGREGREMTEIGFLLDAGAVAFSDVFHVVQDSRVMARAMTYARSMGALVVGHPQDPGLSRGACATSGKFASLRGLPAVHPMAETIALDRDLGLVSMTRTLSRRPDHHGAGPAVADPRPCRWAGRDGGGIGASPDAERIRRGRLSHLLSPDASPAVRG
jgi:dihydroorotase